MIFLLFQTVIVITFTQDMVKHGRSPTAISNTLVLVIPNTLAINIAIAIFMAIVKTVLVLVRF